MKRTYNVLENRFTLAEIASALIPNAKKLVRESKDLPHLQKPIKYLLK
jgi:hypothetical protein